MPRSSTNRPFLIPALAISLAVCSVFVHCGPAGSAARESRLMNQAAPDFSVRGIHGERFTLSQFKGNILVIQFGTSW